MTILGNLEKPTGPVDWKSRRPLPRTGCKLQYGHSSSLPSQLHTLVRCKQLLICCLKYIHSWNHRPRVSAPPSSRVKDRTLWSVSLCVQSSLLTSTFIITNPSSSGFGTIHLWLSVGILPFQKNISRIIMHSSYISLPCHKYENFILNRQN